MENRVVRERNDMIQSNSILYDLNEKNGWLLNSSKNSIWHSKWLQLGRSDFTKPWNDGKFHYHSISQEIYYVLQGELWIIINDIPLKLNQNNLLLVQKNIPHAVVGGNGIIQHYMMKIPHSEDEKIVLDNTPSLKEFESLKINEMKEIPQKSGFYADLNDKKNQNCWLIGFGNTNYNSDFFGLAYMNFSDEIAFHELNHPNEFHYHRKCEEWYFVLEGSQQLLVNNEEITVYPHQLLKIPENIPHKLISYRHPFQGMTIRIPNIKGDKVIVE